MKQPFEELNDAQREQLYDAIDPNAVADRQTLDRIEARLMNRLPKKRRIPAKVWKFTAIAAAACAAIYVTLGFTVPGVADGLYRLAHPDHRTETYFATAPEDRDPVAEIEAAVKETGGEGLGSSVELLGEYSNLTQYDEEYNSMVTETPTYREKLGFAPYDAAEFAFLKEIEATDTEIYYDGEKLFVNCFLSCPDPSVFLRADAEGLSIDTFWQFLTKDGEPVELQVGSWSGGTSKPDTTGRKGIWYSTGYDLYAPLPDGKYEMTLLYYVYDNRIDDMAAPGNVGRIIHQVSFETTSGNRSEKQSVEAVMHGSAPLTFIQQKDETGKTIQNRTVSFDGLKLRFTLRFLPDGTYLSVETEKLPDDWTTEERNAFVNLPLCALDVDLILGGETAEGRSISYGARDDVAVWEYVFPVVASDYRDETALDLCVKIRSVRAFSAYLGTNTSGDPLFGASFRPETDGGPVACPEVWIIEEIQKTPLSESTVTVRLP